MNEQIPIMRPENVTVPNASVPIQRPSVTPVTSTPTEPTLKPTNSYPSEIVNLPSKGYFYDSENPLASGQIELKQMTAREEDILTSQNLIKKGVVLDKLLEALIITPNVKLDDILVGDKNAIFIATRILAYGKDYEVKIKCPSCGQEADEKIDLTALKDKEFDFSKYQKGSNQFQYQLPYSKRVLTYKLLTHKDEQAIDAELKSLEKFSKGNGSSPEITTRLKYMILAVDGKDDRSLIKKYIDNELLSKDSLEFRKHIRANSPDIDMNMNFSCTSCGHAEVMQVPLGIGFFWPAAGV